MKNNIFNSKKFKYGSSATAFTAVVVVAVVIVNIIITSLSSVYGWYTDLTTEDLYQLSDAFCEELDSLSETDGGKSYYNFVLMMDEDKFSTYSAETILVYNTMKQIVSRCDNVSIKAINSTTYPEQVEKYKLAYGDEIALTDVVIELADENFEPVSDATSKKSLISSFFTVDDNGNYYSYNAEARILSAFWQFSGKNTNKPVAFYLQGHGEPTLNNVSMTWVNVLETAGFDVQAINLANEDFSDYYDIEAAGDANNCVVVINDPKFDLYVPTATDPNAVSEVKKIRDFLGTNYGNLIVSVGAETPELPALNDLLSEWGLGYSGTVVDMKHSTAGSAGTGVYADYDQMKTGGSNLASSLYDVIFGNASASVKTIFKSPAGVVVHDNDTMSAHGYNGIYGSYPILYPYSTAKYSAEWADSDEMCLLGMATSEWDVNDSTATKSYAIVVGSTDFLSLDYSDSCMNRRIMYTLLAMIYDEMIAFDDIRIVPFENGTALTVTQNQATAWTVISIVLIPVAAAAVGMVVGIRRRRL